MQLMHEEGINIFIFYIKQFFDNVDFGVKVKKYKLIWTGGECMVESV